MIRTGMGILATAIWVMFLSLAKAAGMPDKRLEEIKRLIAGREAGVRNGN